MHKTTLIILNLFILLSLLATGCGSKQAPATGVNAPQRLTVYTSVYPVYDFTKKIGGTSIEVINIIPSGAEPHSFEPSTRLLAELSKADLFLYNGVGMEPYLEKLQNALQSSSLLMVDTSMGIELISHRPEDHYEHDEHDNHEHDQHHHHGTFDPHIWLSPANAAQQGKNILNALIQVDPANKTTYESNYQVFKERLAQLDAEYRNILSKCKKKTIVVSHDAFAYLARDYGLKQIPVMGLNAEAEPTPGKMKEIIQQVRQHKISYIFFESLVSPRVSETIAREVKARTLVLNPLGGLTEKEMEAGKDYFSIMKENLDSLKIALEYEP